MKARMQCGNPQPLRYPFAVKIMRVLWIIPFTLLSACATREELDREFAARKQAWIDKGLTPEAAEERVFEDLGDFRDTEIPGNGYRSR